jgi:general stress protein 26
MSKPAEVSAANEHQQFREIIECFRDAMLITFTEDQHPHSRPMRIADITEDATVWFATNRYSPKVDEIVHDSQVAITMQGAGKFVSLNGRAMLVEDRERIQQLWREEWKTWFAKGPTDPLIILLAVLPEAGEYWDASGQAAKHLMFEPDRKTFSSIIELDESVSRDSH